MGDRLDQGLQHDVEKFRNFRDLDLENGGSRSKGQSGRRDSIFFLNDSLSKDKSLTRKPFFSTVNIFAARGHSRSK